jgi:hypothetical protein
VTIRGCLIIAGLAACGAPAPKPGSAEDLTGYLAQLAAMEPATRHAEIAGWKLDPELWDRTIVEPFRSGLRAGYSNAFDERARSIELELANGRSFAVRPHYAGDPRLTWGQGVLRWVVPTLYPSVVVERDASPIDTVFLYDGARWRALVGIDWELYATVARFAGSGDCVGVLAEVSRSKPCGEIGWAIADAALRTDRDGFRRTCKLAETLCGKRSR